MLRYLYYPGCSLEGTAREYDASTRLVLKALDVELTELEGWTCCGASAAETSDRLLSLVLAARNLALAEKDGPGARILIPCSACYLNLKRAEVSVKEDPEIGKSVNTALGAAGLEIKGTATARHILDVLYKDLGSALFGERVVHPRKGLRIAPYYGCQCLRPYALFDDPEDPVSMKGFIEAAGASVFPWSLGGACCGAALMTTKPEIGEVHVSNLLKAAKGADAVLTVCPMCQMNLDAHQERLSSKYGMDLKIPVLYLPQWMGLCMGMSPRDLGMGDNLSSVGPILKGFRP